jgi:uncharacterized protein YhbP (UPF0306 family)
MAWNIGCDHTCVRIEREVASKQVLMWADMNSERQVYRADLLFTFDEKFDVDRQLTCLP